MNCVILQPSYIPWRGYFHQIAKADVFVFLDDVQFDRHGWRNRNRIKTQQGTKWLTIPVKSKGAVTKSIPINQIEISWDKAWTKQHLTTLTQSYSKAPFFSDYHQLLQDFYTKKPSHLADYTIDLTIILAHQLGIQNTEFLRSSQLAVSGNKVERLLGILQKVNATHYISGPSAIDYLDQDQFKQHRISLEFMSYNYPEYDQLYPPFDNQVSVLDLMFMTGEAAGRHVWGGIG